MDTRALATELEKAHRSTAIRSARVLEGGSHPAYWIETNEGECFMKFPQVAEVSDALAAERDGLEALARANAGYRVPKVLGVTDKALILEYIAPSRRDAETDFKAGVRLGEFHAANTAQLAGWHRDNYIGALPQRNGASDNTVEHYLNHRIAPMLERAFGLLGRERVVELQAITEQFAAGLESEGPVLLHGDFWSGNFWVDEEGQPVWADPAVYHGHREIDLAMSMLFGGFRDAFYDGYATVFPFDEGWENRVHFWQLYPLLVHVVLFGSSYLGELEHRVNHLQRVLKG